MQRLESRFRPRVFVPVHHQAVAVSLRDAHRHDFVLKPSFLPGTFPSLLAAQRPTVLIAAADLKFGSYIAPVLVHRHAAHRAAEAVTHHRIDQNPVSHSVSESRT